MGTFLWKFSLILGVLVIVGAEEILELDVAGKLPARLKVEVRGPLVLKIFATTPLPLPLNHSMSLWVRGDRRLMGLIRMTNLRRKATFCLDFISVEGGEKICNDVGKTRILRSSYDPQQLSFKIHVEPGHLLGSTLAEIIFVSYSDCGDPEEEGWFRCSKEEAISCIPSSFRCDSQPHCLLPYPNFGGDEKGCDVREEVNKLPQYFVPTAAFLFLLWGLFTLLRKCYKCFRAEFPKHDLDRVL